MMIRCEKNGLVFYRFELFEPFRRLTHGVFTRSGGVSPPPCSGLNLAFSTEDDEANIRENLTLVEKCLGIGPLAFAGQVHGDQSLVVRAEDGYAPRSPAEVKTGYDALITPDLTPLLIKLADCQGVMLFDPETEALALVHSGWRGSVLNILGRTVNRVEKEFGVEPSNLLAGIGPSLGPCCAEFKNYESELPENFWKHRKGFDFDFWSISRDQLTEAGLRPEHIEISGICTKCGSEGFYSYRGERTTGRFGLAAGRRVEG